MPWLLAGGMLTGGLTVLLSVIGLAMLLLGSAPPPKVAAGVSVAGVPLGGQTLDEATAALAAHDFAAQNLTLADGEREWTVTLGSLGIGVDATATAVTAFDAARGATVQPWYTIDLTQTQNGLVALADQVNVEAVPGNPPQIGRAMDVPVMLSRLYQNLAGEIGDGVFELSMIEIEPPEPDSPNVSATERTVHVVERGQELGLIARQYGVSIEDILALNNISDPNLLYIGQELTIPAAGLYTPRAEEAPPAPTTSGKSILVSTGEQRIYAYENGQLVRSHLTSTGLPATPTVLGDYKVYVKYVADDMSGPDYFLPAVPYTMYFYQGYAIHGTYWHNSFGRPMSHGCVNLPTEEAQWFFEWAEVGTPVRVI
jgi:lipoprotein-anchoring transpeptidase ErfK/SrfK